MGRWFGHRSVGRKVAWASFSLASIWFEFGSITYKPLCKANVVAENMVQMTAPLAGRLMAIHVPPGQDVRAGQLLVEFDTTDLALQLQGLERETPCTLRLTESSCRCTRRPDTASIRQYH